MKRIFSLVLTLAMVLSIATGCSSGTTSTPNNPDTSTPGVQEYDGEKILHIATGGQLASLNCVADGGEFYDGRIDMNGSMVTLMVKKDGSGFEFVPNHAEKLPTGEEGGKVFNVKIRDDITWTDGTPITAETYEYTFKMMLDPLLAYGGSKQLYAGAAVVTNALSYFKGECEWEDVGIKVLDGNIIQFQLDAVCADLDFWESVGACVPAHKELFEAGMNADRTSTTYATTVDQTPCGGVWQLTEWVLDQKIVFTKNENAPLADYYKIDGIEIILSNDATAKYQMFMNGEIDSTGLSAANYDEFVEDPRLKEYSIYVDWGLWLNQESDTCTALGIKEFRQALYYAAPREPIAKNILKTATPAAYYVPKVSFVGDLTTGGQRYRDTAAAATACATDDYRTDYDKAKSLFDTAYVANGNTKIVMEVQYMETNDSTRILCEYLKEEWENLFGADRFELVLSAIPPITVYSNLTDGKFEASFAAATMSIFNPWDGLKCFRGDYNGRRHRWNDDTFNDLQTATTKGDLVNDIDKRIEALAEMEKILIDGVPFVPFYVAGGATIFSDRIVLASEEHLPYVEYGLFQCDITGPQVPFESFGS